MPSKPAITGKQGFIPPKPAASQSPPATTPPQPAQKPAPARVATRLTGAIPNDVAGPKRMESRRAAPLTSTGRAPQPMKSSTPSFFDKPILSTIDKYVLSAFVKNYLISLLVLIGLYVVLDMVFNFDEFVKVNGHDAAEAEAASALHTLRTIVDFYFFQSFRIFSHLAGIVPVVATAFTLVRMSRFNELAALLAAGVPLRRVAQPIILASLLVNGGLLMINQELIVPSMIDKLSRDRGDADSNLANRGLEAMPLGDNDVLFASRYTLPRNDEPATMDRVYVLEKHPDGTTSELAAERATYDEKASRWTLVNGQRMTIYPDPNRQTTVQSVADYDGDNGSLNPETIALFVSRGDFVDLLSTERIRQLLLQKNTAVGRIDLMRVRDARWANYVLNVVLVLLTIPCVLTREPTQLKTAAARVFLLIGACMATIFVTQNLAGQQAPSPNLANTWPAIMAWLPIFLFAPIAIWLLDRIKT